MRSRFPAILAGLLAVGAGSPALAAPQVHPYYELDPIVITATRTATRLSEIGSSVEIVTGEELRERGAVTLLEALSWLPGVTTARSGPAAGTASLFLRGAKSEHLLVLIDGVKVNDVISPGGSFDWNTLSSDAIERIEVVKGPQGTLYGSEAVAGVVNIITRRSATPRGSIQVEAGGYEALRAAAGMGGTWGEGTYRLEVSRTTLGGTSSASDSYAGNVEEDGWSMWSGALSARRSLLKGVLDATLRGSRSRFDMDDYGGPMGDDPNSLAWKADLAGSLQWSSPAGGRWDHRFLLGGSRIHRWSADGSDDAHPDEHTSSDYRGRVQSGEWHHTLDLSRHLLAFGFTATRESGSSRYESTSMGFTYADPLAEAHMWSTSAYLQDQVRLGGMVLTIGGRADRYADYGTRPTWRVAGAVRVGQAEIRASAGSGFRVPSLYQRNSPLYGNPDLRAERTMGWEVGVALRPSGRGRVELAHYRQDVEEMIDFVTDPTTFTSSYANRSSMELLGWELSAHYLISAHLALQGAWTATASEDDSGRQLIRRPRITSSIRMQLAPRGAWSTELGVRHVGGRDDLDFSTFPATRTTLEPVTLVEGYVAFRAGDTVTLRLRGENLTDAEPEWVWGYGSRGRALYLSVLLEL